MGRKKQIRLVSESTTYTELLKTCPWIVRVKLKFKAPAEDAQELKLIVKDDFLNRLSRKNRRQIGALCAYNKHSLSECNILISERNNSLNLLEKLSIDGIASIWKHGKAKAYETNKDMAITFFTNKRYKWDARNTETLYYNANLLTELYEQRGGRFDTRQLFLKTGHIRSKDICRKFIYNNLLPCN